MARNGQTLVMEVRSDLDETIAANWNDPDLLMWVNKGIVRLVSATRSQRQHWFDKEIISTDSALTIRDETYDPTVSLKPTVGGSSLVLPPNCIEIVSIEPTDLALIDRGVTFEHLPPTRLAYKRARNATQHPDTCTYYFYTMGKRTLKIAPKFGLAFDIVLQYVAMPDEITFSTVPTEIADWMLDLAVLYAQYRALYAIKHDDYVSAMKIYEAEEKKMMELNRPRESSNPVVVESLFEGWDSDDW